MGVLFQPSAPIKSDYEHPSDGVKNNLDCSPNVRIPIEEAPSPAKKLDFPNVELQTDFESISLPPTEAKQEAGNDGTVSEFFPQFIGILPGLLVMFACGMQLSWSILAYDMAMWKKMYELTYCMDVLYIISWYLGAIIGSAIGGLMVLHLGKRFIYLITAFLIIFGGECLKDSDIPFYHITGRGTLGVTYAIAQLAAITYASETTAKRVRTGLLSLIGYVNALSVFVGILLASAIPDYGTYDENVIHANRTVHSIETEINTAQDNVNDIVWLSGIVIMLMGAIILVIAPFITRESIPFLIRKHHYDKAFDEYRKICSIEKTIPTLRDDFECWKLHVLATPAATIRIFTKVNWPALRLIGSTRLLSLFFNSVFMAAVFIRLMNVDEFVVHDDELNENLLYDKYDQKLAVELLIGCKTFQILIGLALLLISLKWNVDRFCYKMAFIGGLCVCVLYVIFSCLDYVLVIPINFVAGIFFVILIVFLMLPTRMDIFHYGQITESFVEDSGCKVWTLVFVNCIEHLVHIFLLIQIFLFVSYPVLLTGFGILYISLWLLKNMPTGVTVQPWENAHREAKKWDFLRHNATTTAVHM